MNVFVTGTESFIGKAFLDICVDRQTNVFGVDLAAPKSRDRMPFDIRSPGIADVIPEGTDAVVHLAAVSRGVDCRTKPALAYDINVMGTVNLLEAAKKRGVRQFVFASSEWVYGEVDNQEIQREDQPIDVTRIKSEYALSKLAGEQILKLASAQGGPGTTILRFGIVYGPRMQNWSAVESLVNSTVEGGAVRIGSRATARRFIHVGDIAKGIHSALGRSGFEIFNLSGNRLITLGDLIEETARLTGRQIVIQESSPNAVSIRNPDNKRARTMLPWRPEIGLSEGIRDLLRHFQKKEAA